MTINERMFKLMDERGLHPADLCKVLGRSTSMTTTWKQRGTDPPAKYIPKIAEFLGVSIDYLLTGEEPGGMDQQTYTMLTLYDGLSKEVKDAVYISVIAASEAKKSGSADGFIDYVSKYEKEKAKADRKKKKASGDVAPDGQQ